MVPMTNLPLILTFDLYQKARRLEEEQARTKKEQMNRMPVSPAGIDQLQVGDNHTLTVMCVFCVFSGLINITLHLETNTLGGAAVGGTSSCADGKQAKRGRRIAPKH